MYIYDQLFQKNGFLGFDESGKLTYIDSRNDDPKRQFYLKKQNVYHTNGRFIPELDDPSPEELVQRSYDYFLYDSITKKIPGLYIPFTVDLVRDAQMSDILRYNRRFSKINIIKNLKNPGQYKISKFLKQTHKLFQTIPKDVLLENFKAEIDHNLTRLASIADEGNRLVSLGISGKHILVYIDTQDPQVLIFSTLQEVELTTIERHSFPTEILEIRALDGETDERLSIRCMYSYHVIRVKFKENLKVRILHTLTFDKKIKYSCTNMVNEHLVCAGDTLLYNSECCLIENVRERDIENVGERFRRGILSDPRTLVQISDREISVLDFRCKRNFDTLMASIQKFDDALCPLLDSNLNYPPIFYIGSLKNINLFDLRNPVYFPSAFEHKLNEPSYSVVKKGSSIPLFFSYKNNLNNVGLILDHSDRFCPTYVSVTPKSNEPLGNIIGVAASLKKRFLNIYLVDSYGSVYYQKYGKGRSRSLSDDIKLSGTPLKPYEIQGLPPQKGDLGFISNNKKIFLKLQNRMKNRIETTEEIDIIKKIQLKKNSWQILASSKPEMGPKADEFYQKWFIKSKTDDKAGDQCVPEEKPEEIRQTINMDILGDDGF
ncbi:hypothetical protein RF11_15989 [Thelohanellus kitauei]|uniref:Uncharacterized protein n=1 Tax=Thelohanellus kitauei TaxID=669202 RepID=A0A0C2MQA1_THEKT|nr:hypothetical protein RF11_15989 [Thelohanellus kitauei]